MSKVAEFYDDYTVQQVAIGINDRNLSIQKWLEEYGLQPHHDVLEIGCGIGTQTQLLAEYLSESSKITANDISPKSIEIAKQRLSQHKNIEWFAVDIIQQEIDHKYDVVLLPDVLEHIPIDHHFKLFEKIKSCLKPDGFVLIHIPNPLFLEWCHVHMKDGLQVIDQPIFTDMLVKNAYPHGFYIHTLRTYSIWIDHGDYQVIVLKPHHKLEDRHYEVTLPKVSLITRIKQKISRTKKKLFA